MLCLPSLLYLIASFLALISSFNFHKMTFLSILASILFILVWTWLLNLLCRKKHEGIAWILFLLPLVGALVAVAIAFEVYVYNAIKHSASNLPAIFKSRNY